MKDLFGIRKRNIALTKANDHLRVQNLRLRLQMDILIDQPGSAAAEKIKAGILAHRKEINEIIQATNN